MIEQDKQLWGFSNNDPIVVTLELQLRHEHKTLEEVEILLSKPLPNITKEDVKKFCLEHYGGGLLAHWLED